MRTEMDECHSNGCPRKTQWRCGTCGFRLCPAHRTVQSAHGRLLCKAG